MDASLSNNLENPNSWPRPEAKCLARVRLLWADEVQMAAFAQWLANRNGIAQAFVALDGDLGAGKTTWVRYLLRSLGVVGRIKSPTYTLMETYQSGRLEPLASQPLQPPSGDTVNISHFDFYRFNDPQEWEDAGFRDVFAASGLKLVEWPEKAGLCLPDPDLLLHIVTLPNNHRAVTVYAYTPLGCRLLQPNANETPLPSITDHNIGRTFGNE